MIVLGTFTLTDELFAKTLQSFETFVLGSNNLCRKLISSLELPIKFDERFKVTSPPRNKKSWRHRNNVSLYVPEMPQVCLKWNTQRRLSGTSPRRLSGTSLWRLVRMSRRLLKLTFSWSPISMSPRRLKTSLNWKPNNVSVVHIHDIPLVSLYDVSCHSQMKHPITLLWYISTTSWSYVAATPRLYFGLY